MLLVAAATVATTGLPSITIATDARALQPGEVVRVTISTAEPVDGLTVRVFDRDWPTHRIADDRWQALVGIDLDTVPRRHVMQVRTLGPASAEESHAFDVEPKAFRTRNLTVSNAFVNPPAETQARIEREAVELNRIWRSSPPTPLWTGAFERPVPHEANSAFGSRSVFNGQPRSPHGGADFLSPAGTPVVAPAAGTVVLADDLYYTGGTVTIDHGMGLISLFAHLSSIDVEKGTTVQAGDLVGKVGATGRVTGAHLHWTVRLNGTRVDPLSVLAVLGR